MPQCHLAESAALGQICKKKLVWHICAGHSSLSLKNYVWLQLGNLSCYLVKNNQCINNSTIIIIMFFYPYNVILINVMIKESS